jgi:hypothetical protein
MGIVAIGHIYTDTIKRVAKGSDAYACYEEVCNRCCSPRCIGIQWILLAFIFQIIGACVALAQMSDECNGVSWFICMSLITAIDDNDYWEELRDWERDLNVTFDGVWDKNP